MGKLYETFKKIDNSRKKCINNLRSISIDVSDDATLDEIAVKILDKGGNIDFAVDNKLWQRPDEWVDTKEILLNAPTLEGYTPFALFLLHDNRPTVKFSLTPSITANGKDNIRDAYYMSDGTFVTHSEQYNQVENKTHTWDTTKDIKTNLGYNLRYMICYANDKRFGNIPSSLLYNPDYEIGNSLLEVVYNPIFGNVRWYIPNRQTSNNFINVQRIHILDGNTDFPEGQSSNAYNSVREIQIDNSSDITISKSAIFAGIMENPGFTRLILPNAKTITFAASSSNVPKFSQVYAPNLTSITRLNSTYKAFGTSDLYAPKLQNIEQVTVSKTSAERLPNLDNYTSLELNGYDWYMNKVAQYIDKEDLLISASTVLSTGTMLYNPYTKELKNTSALSGYRIIDLPQLQKVALSTVFGKNIVSLNIGHGFKSNLNISGCIFLQTVNILDILNKLADVTNEDETYTLTLGTTLLSLLSDEEKAIATNKGWVLE